MRTRSRALLVSLGVVLLGAASLPLGAAAVSSAPLFAWLDPLLTRPGDAAEPVPEPRPTSMAVDVTLQTPTAGVTAVEVVTVADLAADDAYGTRLREDPDDVDWFLGDGAVLVASGCRHRGGESDRDDERGGPEDTGCDWMPAQEKGRPVVTGGEGGVRVTSTSRTSSLDPRRPVDLEVSGHLCAAPDCRAVLRVVGRGWLLSAVRPAAAVREQRPHRVVVDLGAAEGDVTVRLRPAAGDVATVSVPVRVERVVQSLAVLGWPLVPWLLLLVRARGHLRGKEADDPPAVWTEQNRVRLEALVLLLGLGLVVLWLRLVQLLYGSLTASSLLARRLPALVVPDDWGLVNVAIAGALTVWVVAAIANDLLGHGRSRWQVRAVAAATLVAVAVTVVLVAVSVARGAGEVDAPAGAGPGASAGLLLTGLLLTVGACVLLARGVSPMSGASAVAAALGACAAVVVALALVSDTALGNHLQPVLAVLVAAAVVVVPVVLVVDRVLWLSRWWTLGLVAAAALVAALIALPSVVRPEQGEDLTPYAVMWGLRGLLQVLLLVVGLALLHGLRGCEQLPRHLVLAFAYVLLLRPDLQYAYVPWSFLAGVVLVHLVLVPANGYPAEALTRAPVPGHRQRVRALLLRSGVAGAERHREDTWLDRLGKGDLDAATEQQLRDGPPLADRPAPGERREVTSWPVSLDPWLRAGAGALVGATVGVVLQLSYLTEQLSVVSSVVGLGSWAALFLLAMSFQFPLYGLFFGWFFPLLPGTTGLAKAARFFLVIAVVESVALLVPLDATTDLARALLVRLLQLAVLCGLLGVGADLRVLSHARVDLSQLRALYGTSRLVIWAAGIVVAVATTVATAMLGSAATLLLEEVQPWVPGGGAGP